MCVCIVCVCVCQCVSAVAELLVVCCDRIWNRCHLVPMVMSSLVRTLTAVILCGNCQMLQDRN